MKYTRSREASVSAGRLRRVWFRSLTASLLVALLVVPAYAMPEPKLQLRTLGAARMVTGSMHLLRGPQNRGLLIDAGMFQGPTAHQTKNDQPLSKAALKAEALVLTHVHIDHSGMLPRLVQQGFKGKIYMSRGSAELAEIMLTDSGRIQEGKADRQRRQLNRHITNSERQLEKVRDRSANVSAEERERLLLELPQQITLLKQQHRNIKPSYTSVDVQETLKRIVAVEYGERFEPVKGMSAKLTDPGHIFGSASVLVDAEVSKGKKRRVVFSGDIGRRDSLLFNPPAAPERADYLVMEGTNGDTVHQPINGVKKQLYGHIRAAAAKGGKVVIPAFSLGRTQELIYLLSQLKAEGKLKVPVYIDSQMSVSVTEIFSRNVPMFNAKVQQHGERTGGNPFSFPGLNLVRTVEESKALKDLSGPAVIISSAGMCNAGRIRHHLANTIGDPKNTVVFVGYQAEGTLGHHLQGMTRQLGASQQIRLNGQNLEVKAKIGELAALHGHGDSKDLHNWVKSAGNKLRKVFLVHGEESRLLSLGKSLEQDGCTVEIPFENKPLALD